MIHTSLSSFESPVTWPPRESLFHHSPSPLRMQKMVPPVVLCFPFIHWHGRKNLETHSKSSWPGISNHTSFYAYYESRNYRLKQKKIVRDVSGGSGAENSQWIVFSFLNSNFSTQNRGREPFCGAWRRENGNVWHRGTENSNTFEIFYKTVRFRFLSASCNPNVDHILRLFFKHFIRKRKQSMVLRNTPKVRIKQDKSLRIAICSNFYHLIITLTE